MTDALAADVAKKLSLSHSEAAKAKQPYYAKRVALFEQYKARSSAEVEAARARAEPIAITLPDGSVKPGVKGVTTPLDVALGISKGLAAAVVVSLVDGATWDVFRPLEGDCHLKLCTFDDAEGRDVRAVPGSGRKQGEGGIGGCLRVSPLPRAVADPQLLSLLRRRSGTSAPTC